MIGAGAVDVRFAGIKIRREGEHRRRRRGIGAAYRAIRMRIEPRVDARHVKRVCALRQRSQLLSVLEISQADGASRVIRIAGAAVPIAGGYVAAVDLLLVLVRRDQTRQRGLVDARSLRSSGEKNIPARRRRRRLLLIRISAAELVVAEADGDEMVHCDDERGGAHGDEYDGDFVGEEGRIVVGHGCD